MSSGTGFFTDITLCIGCKACEVACKQWNQLPAEALYGGYVLRKSVVHAGRDSADDPRAYLRHPE